MNIIYAIITVLLCALSYGIGYQKGFLSGLNELTKVLDEVADYLQERDKKNPS